MAHGSLCAQRRVLSYRTKPGEPSWLKAEPAQAQLLSWLHTPSALTVYSTLAVRLSEMRGFVVAGGLRRNELRAH